MTKPPSKKAAKAGAKRVSRQVGDRPNERGGRAAACYSRALNVISAVTEPLQPWRSRLIEERWQVNTALE
jgi:hypothetical protein